MHPLIYSAVLLIFLSSAEIALAERRSHCNDRLPTTLDKLIKQRYPEWQIGTGHDRGCKTPILKVDFYGDGRTVYAMVIEKIYGYGGKVDLKFIVAEKKAPQWELILVENLGGYIYHEPRKELVSVYEDKVLRSKGDLIILWGGESWAIAYGWTGDKIDRVHLRD